MENRLLDGLHHGPGGNWRLWPALSTKFIVPCIEQTKNTAKKFLISCKDQTAILRLYILEADVWNQTLNIGLFFITQLIAQNITVGYTENNCGRQYKKD